MEKSNLTGLAGERYLIELKRKENNERGGFIHWVVWLWNTWWK